MSDLSRAPVQRGSGVRAGPDVVLRQAGRDRVGLGKRPGAGLPGPGEDPPQARDTRVHPGRAGPGNRAEARVTIIYYRTTVPYSSIRNYYKKNAQTRFFFFFFLSFP
jgi:hypothetical protein